VPTKWWRDPLGIPPRAAKARERPLVPWEVTAYRLWLAAGPVALAGISIALGNPGGVVLALLPPFQVFLMPDHQRKQVLGRK
jgi:hypothetical protein